MSVLFKRRLNNCCVDKRENPNEHKIFETSKMFNVWIIVAKSIMGQQPMSFRNQEVVLLGSFCWEKSYK